MKKLLVLSLGALALVANLTSCKKGENDPFLSLSSRKARLAGEWTVSSETRSSVNNYTSSVLNPQFQYETVDVKRVTETNYNGSIYNGTQTTTTKYSTSTIDLGPEAYVETYKFEKDGTYEHTIVDVDGQEVEKGTWFFLGKNKDLELKKKEAITLTVDSRAITNSNGVTTTYTSTGYDGDVLVIDLLKKKEITFIYEYSSTDEDGETNTSKTTTKLTAK
jgi:hypothetical protein